MPSHIKGVLYLIHFDRPLRHARHYLGWATEHTWVERLEEHRRGQGSRLMAVVAKADIPWRLARTWEGVDRFYERRIKKQGRRVALCPVCREQAKETKARAAIEAVISGLDIAILPV